MPIRRKLTKYRIDRMTGNMIEARTRKIMQFGVDFFLENIATGRCCFVCGRPHSAHLVTDEHVIPRWLTKRFGTENSHMLLHNGGRLQHARYTVPCCSDCNNHLSEALETPVSALLKLSYDGLSAAIDNDPNIYQLIFQWCALIFFKMQLKDQFLSQQNDPRINPGAIGDLHCWESLNQVLTVARIKYTGALVDPDVYGSVIILPRLKERDELSDYLDCSTAQIAMIQAGEIVIFVVLNDSKACLAKYRTFLSKIDGLMTEVQCRELFARLRYLNDNLKGRPRYRAFITGKNRFKLQVERSRYIELCQGKEEKVSLFSLMREYIGPLIPDIPARSRIWSDLEKGKAQYIFDANDKFCSYADRLGNEPAPSPQS